jgi:hypothetical protein
LCGNIVLIRAYMLLPLHCVGLKWCGCAAAVLLSKLKMSACRFGGCTLVHRVEINLFISVCFWREQCGTRFNASTACDGYQQEKL